MTDLISMTIAEARDGLANKTFTSLELTDAHLKAIEAARALNAFVLETPDRARTMAREADAKMATGAGGPLAGIPLGIKDLFATRGVRTTACSKILGNFVPTYESTVTSQLWRDGAVMLGKLNNDEFAMGSSNETSCFGPVVNPWRLGVGGGGTVVHGRDRNRHRRLDPPASGIYRDRRHEADLWPLFALGNRRLRILARSGRADRAYRAGCCDPDALDGRSRSQGHHVGRSRGAGLRGRDRKIRKRHEDRHPTRISPRRHARGNRKALERGRGLAPGRGRRTDRRFAASHQIRASGLLYCRAG